MSKFTTVSPTHIEGRKEYAWERFRDGGYVSIGWLDEVDLSGKRIEEIVELIRQQGYDNEASAIESFKRFLSLAVGDYVAVNNTNHGLFGVGVVESGYLFRLQMHDTGAEDPSEFYSHYRKVRWVVTSYTARTALVSEGETGWQPYGTVGRVWPELPPYISRLLGSPVQSATPAAAVVSPAFLAPVIEAINTLRGQATHLERAHESLVEDFFVALGYRKHQDIKYRQGRVDIAIESGGQVILIVEVKAAWDLSWYNGLDAIKQAYGYAHDRGVRYVLVTNGDTYLLFDRLKGLSWESNLLGEFRLTSLHDEDIELIDRLRAERLASPSMSEALRHLAESFSARSQNG